MAKQTKQPTPDDQQLEELRAQIDELTTDLQRVSADFANFKRRTDEERKQLSQLAKTEVVRQLLPLIDNTERAIGHMPKELAGNQWVKGVAQLSKQFEATLKKLGVEKIPATGQPFDPNLHEAVSYEEDGAGDEIIVEELQPGYKAGDDVVRHSMVRVGRKHAPPEQVAEQLEQQKQEEPVDKEIPED